MGREDMALRTADFMDNPMQLRRTLEDKGALEFIPFEGGLFPASPLSEEMAQQTEMDGAWFRDNAHVARALYENGRRDLAISVGEAMLTVLNNNRTTLDEVITGGSEHRLPIRVNGNTLENMVEPQPRVQHDSTGYLLGYTSLLLMHGAIRPDRRSLETILHNKAKVVQYLKKIEYWHEPDAGRWEEEHRIHASSIGVVLSGLRAARKMFKKLDSDDTLRTQRDIDELTENGTHAFNAILAQGVTDLPPDGTQDAKNLSLPWSSATQTSPSPQTEAFFRKFSTSRREHDAALLFLAEPLDILDDERAADIVAGIENNLVREKGVARYAGDTYWGPGFKEILNPTERTVAAEGRLELRNLTAEGIAYTQTEAQWTLFDPILAPYWAKQYLKTSNPEAREKYFHYTDRSLGGLVPQADGSLKWPEAYYHEFRPHDELTFQLTPNDHMPLLWTQANNLRALRYFPRLAL